MLSILKQPIFLFFTSVGKYIILIHEVITAAIKKPPSWITLRDQLYSIGVSSLNVVSITGISTGVVLAAQSFYQLSNKGLASITGIMVAKAMIRTRYHASHRTDRCYENYGS